MSECTCAGQFGAKARTNCPVHSKLDDADERDGLESTSTRELLSWVAAILGAEGKRLMYETPVKTG